MNAIHNEPVLALQTVSSGAQEVTIPAADFAPLPFPKAGFLSQPGLSQLAPEGDMAPAPYSRCDTFHFYLREIGQVKLLTPEEEILLAERIKQGDEQAREQMIKANLRLVVKIARDYEGLGLPLLDLIGEGNIGLIKGVERFRPNKGAKLSTYAAWWIKDSIRRALSNQSKIIRLPVHVTHKVAGINRTEDKLRDSLDREATDQEIAEEMEISPKRLKRYRDASRIVVSLDSAVSNQDSTPISECIADENATGPFEALVKEDDDDLLSGILAMLDSRESKILAMRFGLDDGQEKTLEEIGRHFAITRERVAQILEQALERARMKMGKRCKRRAATPTVGSSVEGIRSSDQSGLFHHRPHF